jgi:hypothetical protein
MNANFGIVESLDYRVKGGKIAKYEVIAARALDAIDCFGQALGTDNYKKRKSEEISDETDN